MKRIAILFTTLVLSALMAQMAWAGQGVLLVDDDLSCLSWGDFYDVRPEYVAAMNAAKMTLVGEGEAVLRGQYEIYEVTEVDNDSLHGPPLSKLEQYEIVIWFTGTTCGSEGCIDGCVTARDEENLGDYLAAGGKLFLCAQDYLDDYGDQASPPQEYYDFSPGDFPYDWLKISHVDIDEWKGDGTDLLAKGDPDAVGAENITHGMCFELQNPFSTKSQLAIDEIQAISKDWAYEFMIKDVSGVEPDSGYTGISWDTGTSYTGPAVFFSTICFAALKDDVYPNTKANLMSLILSHFYGDYGDYGDAPDPDYCTLYVPEDPDESTIHVNSLGIYEWLGTGIDLEFNAFCHPDSDLYDDGVVFHFPYTPGAIGSVSVTASISEMPSPTDTTRYFRPWPWGGGGDPIYLYLSAWFDWNQDGDWNDNLPPPMLECVIDNFLINPIVDGWTTTSHTYTITFPVPDWATEDPMWCRFRLSHDDDFVFYSGMCGYMSWGEVEDYMIVLDPPLGIELSSFYASPGDQQATLYWSTQSEINNLGFYLLRSTDGVNFERVNQGLVEGQGTSDARHDYSYVDKGLTNGVTYTYKVIDVDMAGIQRAHGPIQVTPQASTGVPTEYALSQNYPNPFNAQTSISYSIPTASHVSLKVFNVMGEEVRTLVDADQQANTYQVTWDGRDAGGKQVASGVYFCKLQARDFDASTKMVFMK